MIDFRRRISSFLPLQTAIGQAAAGTGLAVLAAHWILVLRFLSARAGSLSFLRLHYSVAFGVDWVDRWWWIFAFPAAGTLVFLGNMRLANVLARTRSALGTMLLVATALMQALFAAGGAFAILLNS